MPQITSGMPLRLATERAFAFEDLVADLMVELGYEIQREVRIDGVWVDLVAKKDEVLTAVNISLTRKNHAVHKIRADVAKLAQLEDVELRKLVVTGTELTGAAKKLAAGQDIVDIWDLTIVREKVRGFPPLSFRLDNLLGHLEDPRPDGIAPFEEETSRLIKKLRAHIEENNLSPKRYELLCMDVCRHLFSPHLYGFMAQAKTTDGGNQFDFICRIQAGNDFWDGVRYDFRTKAIIFECKNYAQKIGPDQVYSTERYLFSGALRTVCLLISRLGADKHAMRAAQGAMREAGKLIILLSNDDLIEMLRLKSQNGAVEEFLDKRIWDFIVSLPR